MTTLYTFGPAFGLPDPSPFVMKAMMLLKLAKIDFATNSAGFKTAPKGKLPYLEDDGKLIADSTFIRMHLEEVRGIDLDAGLSASERAIAWAFEKMCDEHLYWVVVRTRWMDDQNFNKGPVKFFDSAPALIRPAIKSMVRRSIRKALHGQGFGLHSADEIAKLTARDMKALSDFLGDKPYFMGDRPCSADASIYAFVASSLCELFDGVERNAAKAHQNLVDYDKRLTAEFFPEFAQG